MFKDALALTSSTDQLKEQDLIPLIDQNGQETSIAVDQLKEYFESQGSQRPMIRKTVRRVFSRK